MQKHLLLSISFIFIIGTFLCAAQANRAATRTGGTLSTSSSSGGGAFGNPTYYASISGSNLFCLNNSSMVLNVTLTSNLGGAVTKGYWYYQDFNSDTLESFSFYGANYTYDSVIIHKPGIYHYQSIAGIVGILITSSIPLDNIPGKTIFCPNGSVTLNAPVGTFSAYQWYNDGDLIQGANSNSYSASKAGNYSVQTTNAENGCVLNSNKIYASVYTPPSQLNITHIPTDNSGKYLFIKERTPYSSGPHGHNHYPGTIGTVPDLTIEKYTGYGCANSYLVIDNKESDLNPETVTWYRNGVPVKSFDDKGIVVAGGNGAGAGLNQFDQPYGIFVDSMKSIYVADYNNQRVIKWAAGSNTGEEIIGKEQIFYDYPTDVLLDSQFLYISGANYIYQVSPSFDIQWISFPFSLPHYLNVWGLAVNLHHELYFGGNSYYQDFRDNWEYYFDEGGAVCQQLEAGYAIKVAGNDFVGSDLSNLNYPNGIYVDSLGNLYVADNLVDSLNHFYSRIVKWAPGATSGELVAGGNGHSNAPNQIACGAGITFDKTGNMYVSDAINNRVQLWRPGADHGITIASGFRPWGIKVDDSDNVYVADQTNNRVLKFPSLLHNTIKARLPGVYKAVVTYPGGCSTTSNDFSVIDCTSPGKLLSFEGRLKNDHAVLTWQTASEYNTSYFDVQRSLDGINFTPLGKVSASGSSSSLHNYLYNDNDITHLNANKIYYRVIETDIAGKSLQSNVISVDVKKSGWSFTISPNPVKSSLQVHLNNLYGSTNIALIDMEGSKLTVEKINASGNNVLDFNTGSLAGGLYLIRVINSSQTRFLKFVKE